MLDLSITPQLYFYQILEKCSLEVKLKDDDINFYLMNLLVKNIQVEPIFLNTQEALSIKYMEAIREKDLEKLKQLADSCLLLLTLFIEKDYQHRDLYYKIGLSSFDNLKLNGKIYSKLEYFYNQVLDLMLLVSLELDPSYQKLYNLWHLTKSPLIKSRMGRSNIIPIF